MPRGMHAAQAVAFHSCANPANDERGNEQTAPEAYEAADGIGKIRAQHIETRMGKVQHTHHAKDER